MLQLNYEITPLSIVFLKFNPIPGNIWRALLPESDSQLYKLKQIRIKRSIWPTLLRRLYTKIWVPSFCFLLSFWQVCFLVHALLLLKVLITMHGCIWQPRNHHFNDDKSIVSQFAPINYTLVFLYFVQFVFVFVFLWA